MGGRDPDLQPDRTEGRELLRCHLPRPERPRHEGGDRLGAGDGPAHIVRRAAPLSDGSIIGPTVVLSLLAGPRARRRVRRKKPPVVKIAVGASLADVERRLIQKTLEFARGNKPKTAELLKLSLKTIYNKIKEYGLEH